MNSTQLDKISKYLNVKGNNEGEYVDEYGDIAEVAPTASILSQNEADELNDKVEELQNALLLSQNFNDDAVSRTSSKLSYSSSMKLKNIKSPLSQAGSNLTRLTQIQSLKNELEQEKNARQNLEKELGELKKMSNEINKHLTTLKPKANPWALPTAGVPIRN
jgi:predicted  nucleic acid-binding Zn-ribbon protein